MNRWDLTDEHRNQFKPVLEEYLHILEFLTPQKLARVSYEDITLDLSDTGINPYQLKILMEELGCEEDEQDQNGWQMDFWIYMNRTDRKTFPSGSQRMVIAGCGITFDLCLRPDDCDYIQI